MHGTVTGALHLKQQWYFKEKRTTLEWENDLQ